MIGKSSLLGFRGTQVSGLRPCAYLQVILGKFAKEMQEAPFEEEPGKPRSRGHRSHRAGAERGESGTTIHQGTVPLVFDIGQYIFLEELLSTEHYARC